MESTEDEALVNASRRGDGAAFEHLVRNTARLVYARLALEVRDRHRAEDLTQEVFLIAWRRIGSLQDAAALRPWLMMIATSVLIDDARRSGRKKRSSGPMTPVDDVAAAAVSPLELMATNEQRQRMLDELSGLPEAYRLPLALRYLAGADYETISRQLAMTNGSLRGLLHRGLELLRKRMSE